MIIFFFLFRKGEHSGEDLVHVIPYVLDCHLLLDEVTLHLVNPDVEPLYIHGGIFLPVLSPLQRVCQVLELALVVLLSLQCLFLRNFKLL